MVKKVKLAVKNYLPMNINYPPKNCNNYKLSDTLSATSPYQKPEPNFSFTITKMLEYVKTILLKVSFDKKLFEKELRKAFRFLAKEEEIKELKQWCFNQFTGTYLLIVNRVFSKI